MANSIFDVNQFEDPVTVKQQDGKLSYLKSKLDKNPSRNNVYGLLDELKDRKHLDKAYASIFPIQYKKECDGETLITKAKDYPCLRRINGLLDSQCDANGEYALMYTKYVVDFCETAAADQLESIDSVINDVC